MHFYSAYFDSVFLEESPVQPVILGSHFICEKCRCEYFPLEIQLFSEDLEGLFENIREKNNLRSRNTCKNIPCLVKGTV